MRIIARIPDLGAPAEAAGTRVAPGTRVAAVPRPRPRAGGLAAAAEAWTTWPVAALAVTAVVAWTLASWRDHARLVQQRGEVRLALEPGAAGRADAPEGAVVR